MFKKISSYLRRLTDRIESYADKPHALTALLIISFIEASFFPIPPDVLLIAIIVVNNQKAFKAALYCTIGSIVGGVLGYFIGFGFMDTIGIHIVEFYGKENAMQSFINLYEEYGSWFLAAASFTPIPYKVATITAGMAKMDLLNFILISSFGRALRFFLVGILLYKYGPKIKLLIDKYFDLISVLFLILLIGGFVAIKYIF